MSSNHGRNLITEHAVGVYGVHLGTPSTRSHLYLEVALNKEVLARVTSPAELVEAIRQVFWEADFSISLSDTLSTALKDGWQPTMPIEVTQEAKSARVSLSAKLADTMDWLTANYPEDSQKERFEKLTDYLIWQLQVRSRD